MAVHGVHCGLFFEVGGGENIMENAVEKLWCVIFLSEERGHRLYAIYDLESHAK